MPKMTQLNKVWVERREAGETEKSFKEWAKERMFRSYPACLHTMSTIDEFMCNLEQHENQTECAKDCQDRTDKPNNIQGEK